jgi:transposase-like protein
MAELTIRLEDNRYKIRAQGLYLEWPAGNADNQKALILFLRSFKKGPGKQHGLFTQGQIAQALPDFAGGTKQSVQEHEKRFEESGGHIRDYLNRKRKVDEVVVAVVEEEIRQTPLAGPTELAERVNARLGRTDLSDANMRAALAQIPCTVVVEKLRQQLEVGKVQYKEEYLLAELLAEGGDKKVAAERGLPPADQGMVLSDPTAIKALVTPDVPLGQISGALAWVTFLMTLYYWNVPLSVLGGWMQVHKTTVLRWMFGLAVSVWPILYQWILERVKVRMVYVDEKWIKIKGKWHYWFVVLEAETELPVLAALLPSRSRWACRWVGLMLRRIGQIPKVVMTDGLLAYHYLLAVLTGAKQVLCRFHHQQRVTVWLKKHFTEDEPIDARKGEMKALLQTSDKRTVRRRLERLKAKAAAWGISGWVETVVAKLPALICTIGSVRLPATNNAIERFFRVFNRFYKTRCGFHSVLSAKRELILFLVMYLFTRRDKDGKAPIERIMPEAARMPLYRLINDPFRALGELKNVKEAAPMADFLLGEVVNA